MTSPYQKGLGLLFFCIGIAASSWYVQSISAQENLGSLRELIVSSSCGDGTKDFLESCDDGNTVDTDSCSNDCKIRTACSQEHLSAAPQGCTYQIVKDPYGCEQQFLSCEPICGDGRVNQTKEECDDGNQLDDDGCSNDCVKSVCGDGMLQIHEECDTGIFGEQCGGKGMECQDCLCIKPLFCGDAKKNQDSEQCDDGNTDNTDGCTTLCKTCEIPLLPDAPAGCIYKTQLNQDDCPSAKLVCNTNDVCDNGLQRSNYHDCSCPEHSYLATTTESCIVDPITNFAWCGAMSFCQLDGSEEQTQDSDIPFETQSVVEGDQESIIADSIRDRIQHIIDMNLPKSLQKAKLKQLQKQLLEETAAYPDLQLVINNLMQDLIH